jgi:hypothetical protein
VAEKTGEQFLFCWVFLILFFLDGGILLVLYYRIL